MKNSSFKKYEKEICKTVFAGLSFVTLLFSVLKKTVGIIIFDVLSMCAFGVICFDFKDRGVIPSDSYNWGIAKYLTYIIGLVIIVGAVWLFIEKRKQKKLINVENEI